VLAQLRLTSRGPARLTGAGEPGDNPAHLLRRGAFRVRLAIAGQFLKRGPARQAVLAGDSELRLVKDGKFTGRQAAPRLQLQVAETGQAGKRT
jgi:hypothetical protein